MSSGEQDAAQPELPVARVAVDVNLWHLDRPFDYAVSPAQNADAVPGARVRVRFAGKLRDGFILERAASSERSGTLSGLGKVISAEPVLTPAVAALIRQVADRYAGTFADVARLAVPPRHAATENAQRAKPNTVPPDCGDGPFAHYPTGPAWLSALRAGRRPRAAWRMIPADAGEAGPGDWASGLATAAAATLAGGRGSLLIVPDTRDLSRLAAACTRLLGDGSFVTLSADLGPAARYRAFLAALRGDVSVVIGTRAAAFAPVADLGLVALYDDGDDLLAERRAPYPHAREVLALRAAGQDTAALFASYARSCEVQRMLDRNWLRELAPERSDLRRIAPRVRVAADTDRALERDPAATSARLPHDVFTTIRTGLSAGPVLVQVPRTGYLMSLVCQNCRYPVRCSGCHGPTTADRAPAGRSEQGTDLPGSSGDVWLHCRWCGRVLPDWSCHVCGSRQWRAPVVGAGRTAEELGRAFPQTPVRRSVGGRVLAEVSDQPALVIATPGAEPAAPGGYAAAVVLDTQLALLRADLRAGEEALRRWLNVTSLVRPGPQGGTVTAVGDSADRSLQALVRLDPGGFATRELAERGEARFPPAVKLLTVDGRAEALAEFQQLLQPPEPTDVLGPVELGPNATGEVIVHRLILRSPLLAGARLVAAAKAAGATRSAKKATGALRIRVDPVTVG